jgi:hypothetical protein
MVYVTKEGHEVEYKHPQRPLMKSISVTLLDKATFSSDQLLDVIWKHAGFLCRRVVFNHSYRHENGSLSHTYDLYFDWGPFGSQRLGGKEINTIVAAIEEDLPSHLPVSLRGRSHRAGQEAK